MQIQQTVSLTIVTLEKNEIKNGREVIFKRNQDWVCVPLYSKTETNKKQKNANAIDDLQDAIDFFIKENPNENIYVYMVKVKDSDLIGFLSTTYEATPVVPYKLDKHNTDGTIVHHMYSTLNELKEAATKLLSKPIQKIEAFEPNGKQIANLKITETVENDINNITDCTLTIN